MAETHSVAQAQGHNLPTSEVRGYLRASRLKLCALLAFAIAHAPLVSLAAGRQLPLAPIDLLPNAPTTYQMRDWRQVATDFDSLAFDTTAMGDHLPLVRIDNTPASSQLQQSFGLPAYVGDMRTVNGELVHESLASLGAVLGGTLVGIDKTTGPYNWVAMTREYYVDRNSQYIILNKPADVSGNSAWYETFPSILFYSIADRYPGEATLQTALNTVDLRFYSAVNKLTAGGAAPNFNYSAYNFSTETPVNIGTRREPDMGLGMAWLQHAAYRRNRASNPTQAAAHLTAVDWALAYYETRSTNPNYEILTSFGAYAAARMNAEEGRNYNVHKYLDWVFSRSAARADLVMISGEQWGGEDVGGLLGTTRANSNPVQGYAFAMNTYANAMPVVALVRYEDRYSRAIGKWMLNAANAARLFYGNEHPPQNQSSELWLGDPQHSIAYEGLRHNWQNEALGESKEIYAAGDPLSNPDWGPISTDFGIYGSAYTGVFGSVIRTTNVEKILQLDVLATDSYRDAAHKTFLYYNPHPTDQSVAIDLGNGQPYDLYDAVSNRFVKRAATGNTFFSVPKDEAVMLVLVPSGGTQAMVGRKLLVNDVVIDYNATLLPDNLVRNPDVDAAHPNNPNRPSFWHYSSNATWSDDVALSPTHALELADNSATAAQDWRSYATDVPAGEDRTFQLRWFWKYDVAAGGEFRARLRLSEVGVGTSLDLTNPSFEYNFTVSGEVADFEMFETTIVLPDGVRSFDLTFISGGISGGAAATGTIFIDDISASIIMAPVLPGDYNDDGIVDAADYVVWRNNEGTNNMLHNDLFGGMIGQNQYNQWRSHFGDSSGNISGIGNALSAVPEPVASTLCLMGMLVMLPRRRASVS